MPLFEIKDNRFDRISSSTFQDMGIKEREDLQRLLKNDISVISKDLLVISEEFGDWEGSNRRIDLLAVDQEANLVVIELKRTNDGGHMELQALRYAAMISTMTFQQACTTFEKYIQKNNLTQNASEVLTDFFGWEEPEEEKFGNDVKIILISADFSIEITTSVLWLIDRGIDIKCFRIIPHNFSGHILVDIQQIIPLPEAESFQIKVRDKSIAIRKSLSQKKKWTLEKLLNSIEQGTNSDTAKLANNIYDWSVNIFNRIWWSEAKIDGSFIPVYDSPNGESNFFFAVRSVGKIELFLNWMSNHKPFDDDELRQEFIDKLNNIGASIPPDKHDKKPKFPLSILHDPEKFKSFKQTIEWALELAKESNL